jgi:hypothetical protein
MESKQRWVSWAVAAVFAACLFSQGATAAFANHKRHHHHYRQAAHSRLYMHRMLANQFGTFPNIQYFMRDGHVFARDLDNGYEYLVRW